MNLRLTALKNSATVDAQVFSDIFLGFAILHRNVRYSFACSFAHSFAYSFAYGFAYKSEVANPSRLAFSRALGKGGTQNSGQSRRYNAHFPLLTHWDWRESIVGNIGTGMHRVQRISLTERRA